MRRGWEWREEARGEGDVCWPVINIPRPPSCNRWARRFAGSPRDAMQSGYRSSRENSSEALFASHARPDSPRDSRFLFSRSSKLSEPSKLSDRSVSEIGLVCVHVDSSYRRRYRRRGWDFLGSGPSSCEFELILLREAFCRRLILCQMFLLCDIKSP